MTPLKTLIEEKAKELSATDCTKQETLCSGYNEDDFICGACARKLLKEALTEIAQAAYEDAAKIADKSVCLACYHEYCRDQDEESDKIAEERDYEKASLKIREASTQLKEDK